MYKKIPRSKWDLPIVGLLLGIIGPVIGYFLYFVFVVNRYYTFSEYLSLSRSPGELSKIISLTLFVNLAIFLVFNRLHKLYVARGVLVATVLYGALIVYLKFLV